MGERFGLSTYLAVGIPQTRERSSNYPYIRKQSSICHACWWLGKTDRQMQKLPVGYWNSNAPALNQLARAEVVGHIFIGNKWLLPTQTMHYPTENGPKLQTILMNVPFDFSQYWQYSSRRTRNTRRSPECHLWNGSRACSQCQQQRQWWQGPFKWQPLAYDNLPYSHLKPSDRQIIVVKLKFLSSWPF